MSSRELVVLGTSSAVPTRRRAHPGLVVRFDGFSVLVDPGEGTQRQLSLAGVSAASIDLVWLTHVHGDHCFGLPGFLQRRAFDGAEPPTLVHPAAGEDLVDALLSAAGGDQLVGERIRLGGAGESMEVRPGLHLDGVALEHRIPAYGMRLREDDGVVVNPKAAAALGITGPDIGRLLAQGRLETATGLVTRDAISAPRRGQRASVVMDTRLCAGAEELAEAADLLITESTFLGADQKLATDYMHLSATDAGRLAADGRARSLVLQHYSQRYPEEAAFATEARAELGDDVDVTAAVDLQRIPFPVRQC